MFLTCERTFAIVTGMKSAETLERAADAFVCSVGSFVDAPCVDQVDEVVARLSSTISRLEALRVRLLRVRGITDRSALAAECELGRGEAVQLEKVIVRLALLPGLQAAAESGAVSMSKIRLVADVVKPERVDAAVRDGEELASLARGLDAKLLGRALDRWAHRVDEERGIDPDEDLRSKRSLETQKRSSGMTERVATLDPESAEVVAAALDARVQSEWRGESAEQHGERTSAQRRADALVGICSEWLNGLTASSGEGSTGGQAGSNVAKPSLYIKIYPKDVNR